MRELEGREGRESREDSAITKEVDLAEADHYFARFAEVVELVDALRSGRSGRKPVRVRVPPSALYCFLVFRSNRPSRLSPSRQHPEPLTHPKWWPILCLGNSE